jgi:hypothetical protein
MVETYLYLFIGICVVIIAWSLIRLERVYQYPFFMAAIFLSFILPQAYALVDNASSDPMVSTAALQRVLFHSCMCAGMCWIGYQYNPTTKWLNKLNIPINERRLSISGVVLLIIGLACYFSLSQITIQIAANGNWTGPATILSFFSTLIFVAFPIFLIKSLKNPNFINITLTIIAAIPIIQIIANGRRQPTITFLIAIGLSFFLVKKYIPPRLLFVFGVIAAAFIVPVLGRLRGDFWSLAFSGDWQSILSESQTGLNEVIKGDVLELRNAALMMDAAENQNNYGYGAGFWDSLVLQFVPGQIIGFDLKLSFQFQIRSDLEALYGYTIPNGSTPTGISDSFTEFGYFGSLLFALIGCMFKTLWISAINRNSLFAALLYISLISPAMVGITHGIGRFCQEFIFQLGTLCLVAYFCREKKVRPRGIHDLQQNL